MYEFFEYVLDQLKNSLILALLALFAAGVVLLVAWLIACMLSIYFYLRGKWRKRLADTLTNEGSL